METNPIMCVPYECAPLSVKEFCVSTLHCLVEEDKVVFVFYKITEEEPIPLGYFKMKEEDFCVDLEMARKIIFDAVMPLCKGEND